VDVNAIREALHARPFQAFRLRLADGRELTIPHPDFIAVSPRRIVVINAADESTSILEPLLIVSLEFTGPAPSAPPPAGDNGSSAAGPA
jgi:hypothetical protein